MNDALRVGFAGTPEFAARHLDALLAAGQIPVAVFTQPDRPAGRGRKLLAAPVKLRAQAAELPVFQPDSLRTPAALALLDGLALDVLVVVAYGLILPPAVLASPRLGCINVHASLLPRWRGAAPIQRAIEAGDPETGVTLMAMEAGLDTGPMLARRECAIAPDSNAATLHDALARAGSELLVEVLDDLPGFLTAAEPQDDTLATYARKIDKTECELDWRLDAVTLDRKIRAFNPAPGCFSTLGDHRVKIWEASPGPGRGNPGAIIDAGAGGIVVACGEGALALHRLQFPGGKPLAACDLLNARGAELAPGQRFVPASSP